MSNIKLKRASKHIFKAMLKLAMILPFSLLLASVSHASLSLLTLEDVQTIQREALSSDQSSTKRSLNLDGASYVTSRAGTTDASSYDNSSYDYDYNGSSASDDDYEQSLEYYSRQTDYDDGYYNTEETQDNYSDYDQSGY